MGGLRSCMGLTGCGTIDLLRTKAEFVRISADAYEFRFSTQQVNGTTAGQTHTGAQAAHLLVNDLFQTAFIGNAPFDTFRYQFGQGLKNPRVKSNSTRAVLTNLTAVWALWARCPKVLLTVTSRPITPLTNWYRKVSKGALPIKAV